MLCVHYASLRALRAKRACAEGNKNAHGIVDYVHRTEQGGGNTLERPLCVSLTAARQLDVHPVCVCSRRSATTLRRNTHGGRRTGAASVSLELQMKRCSPDCLCLLARVLSAFALRPVRFTCVNLCARTQSALRHICITRVRALFDDFPACWWWWCVCVLVGGGRGYIASV